LPLSKDLFVILTRPSSSDLMTMAELLAFASLYISHAILYGFTWHEAVDPETFLKSIDQTRCFRSKRNETTGE
jgi:hypothetical protein